MGLLGLEKSQNKFKLVGLILVLFFKRLKMYPGQSNWKRTVQINDTVYDRLEKEYMDNKIILLLMPKEAIIFKRRQSSKMML